MAPSPFIQRDDSLYIPIADVHLTDVYSYAALHRTNTLDTLEHRALSRSSGSDFPAHRRFSNSFTSTGSSLPEDTEPSSIRNGFTLSRERIELRKHIRKTLRVTPWEEECKERENPHRGIDMNMGWNRCTYNVKTAYWIENPPQNNGEILRRFAGWSWKGQNYLLPVSFISDTQAMDISGNSITKSETGPACLFSYIFNTTGQVKQPTHDSLRGRHTEEDEFLEGLSPAATSFPRDVTPITPATTASSPARKFIFRSLTSLPSLPPHQNTISGVPPTQFHPSHNPRKRKQIPALRRKRRAFPCILPVFKRKLETLLSSPPIIKLIKLINLYPAPSQATDELLAAPKRRCTLHVSHRPAKSAANKRKDQRRTVGIRASRMAKMGKQVREEGLVMELFWTAFCWVLDGEVGDWNVWMQRRAFEGGEDLVF